MAKLDRLGWAVSRSYEVAGIAFGLRTNSEPFIAWLDAALGAYRIEEDEPPYYSILIAEAERPGKRFHILYEQTRVLVRSRSVATVAQALLAQLEAMLLIDREDALYIEMTVLASNGRRALVPPILLPLLEAFSRRELERSGLVLPYSTTVAVDARTGELVPMRPVLDVPRDALEGLRRLETGDAEPRVVVDGPSTVDVVASFGGTASIRPVSKAEALYRAASHSLNLGRIGAEAGLNGLRKVVERADCFELGAQDWRRVPESLGAILRP